MSIDEKALKSLAECIATKATQQPDEISGMYALEDLQRRESDCYLADKPFTAAEAYEAVSPYLPRQSDTERESVEQPDSTCVESDGCPTEGAVLKRFWRQYQWQPIETAPKDGPEILVVCSTGIDVAHWNTCCDHEDGWENTSDEAVGCLTHWMPLPNPPQEK